MAYDPCDPCCNTNISFSSNETARFSIGYLLCQILAALGGGGAALTPHSAHNGFASVTLGWTVALTNTDALSITRIFNTTNQPIQISTNGGTDYFTVAAGTIFVADWLISGNISMRATVVPISGELEIYAVS